MKKVLKNVSFMILLLKMCIIFGQETAIQKRILIDVGHGGKDSGAIGVNGILEKDVVLNIASAILKLNNKLDKPLDIYLTRYSDTLISLSDRTKLAKALKADLFLSLHCNHSDNPNARGVEVYVTNAESKYSDDSTWFAFQVQAALNKELGYESRGVKFANFQVLRETVDVCTSVLIELGFLSNKDEGNYISNSNNIQLIATAILLSIQN
ncbi:MULTISPECIES: N-acetylmuramoyl-L-alanine amidase family protein [Flavobacteriaceae]|uniref:N-acetylmuramoyl-L-alanine amidase n=3 Tax=Flavobacteriaceae TaxID=49546 RepID=A0A3E1QEA6_9FLAO|nr:MULTISPECIES: N-acetylmuramoyl-L-alanine amidase [Flavobacteriaceae]MAW95655.1 N-acetylmuramoyl-L-alanine amidase [Leeuwenhoekiella sp.]HAF77012.1 N-acetylmuramoyl-L-alanine amidase [Maribacter sp.]MDN3491308.1 N-acetylmuramoyl-L-alanine amidase [Winogradskyella bathintestinalis]RFN60472.1 N-acetylmuramoyl-L-alanine amidase [Marixanthomonas ophiurae]SIQ16288.1 N-acetylmuramoyl-L-alanine amidase [Maribacter ulvicola]|tara:strand:+ start:3737 stop:4366 length:630 start_codon:yes stop_codon:yes gene_type:complete